jgi:hypothetical protein
LVGFTRVWLTVVWPTGCADPPVIPPVTVGAVQVYVVPAGTIVAAEGTPFTGVREKEAPLQIVIACAGMTGAVFTLIKNVFTEPGHPLALGVTVMVAEISEFVGFAAIKAGIFPEPLAARPILVLLFVHV